MENETFGEYVTRSVQPINETLGYPQTLPWLLETFAELIFVLRYQSLAGGDKEPSAVDVMRYRDMHELDYMTLSITFTAFVEWLIDKEINHEELIENGTEYICDVWNEFIFTEWTKRGDSE